MTTKQDPVPSARGPSAEGGRLSRLFGRLPVFGTGEAVPGPREAADLARKVAVPLIEAPGEETEWREIERGFAALADEGLWMSLLDRLRGVDQSRQPFASGRRYFDCALAGSIASVTRHLGAPPRIDAASAALAPLTTLHVGNLNDYMPAVLLARALIEIGWAVRGRDVPAITPADARRAAQAFFDRAEAAIEAFDPIEMNSPMLAEARYRLAPGIEGGAEFLRDWYEDWADLDPSNPEMLATHGRLLCPDWFGSFEEVDAEARRAVRRAADGLGAGAYPAFWREALRAHPAAVARIDPELYLSGVHAMLEASRSQALANAVAAELYRLGLPRSAETREEAARAAPVRERLADGLREVAARHLVEIHPLLWQMDPAAIRRALAQAFAAELGRGQVLRPGERGLEAGPREGR